jgi:hypothetical protein
MTMLRHICCALAAFALAGCLEPLVSDEPGASLEILPPGSAVPHVSASGDLTRQIRLNDNLNDMALEMSGGVVPLKAGWAAGEKVWYWDLGDAKDKGALLYRLVRREGDALAPVDHPLIADSLPGDPSYSPFWFVQDVVVTERWRGEVLPSADAIPDAVELGLVEEPVPAMLFVDGPIVAAGAKLGRQQGQAPIEAIQVLARGYLVDLLPVGGPDRFMRPMARAGRVPRGDVSRIRVGNAATPQKEVCFQNGATTWTPMVRVIDCHVTPPDPLDPATATISDETMLYVRDDKGVLVSATARVLDWLTTTTVKNWPIDVPDALGVAP